jgi:hypothetical protein
MKSRRILVAVCASALGWAFVLGAGGAGARGSAASFPVTVTIDAVPGNDMTTFGPQTLTIPELAALPQQTVSVSIGGVTTSEQGPLLRTVLADAGFKVISTCKNDELRYFAQATSAGGSAAEVTPGELDPFFGNKAAILSLSENGVPLTAPRLVVPGDATDARDLADVIGLTVGRAAPQLADTFTPGCTPPPFAAPVAAPAPGSVLINGAVADPTTLTWSQLEALPQVSQTVTSLGLGTNVGETGPTLLSAIDLAGPEVDPATAGARLPFFVEVTSSEDGYAANVSWAEIDPGLNGNQILLSLAQNGVSQESTGPKLTVPGDTHAGRFVSGTAVVTVLSAPPQAPAPGSGPDLLGANLSRADLPADFLVGASLEGANLDRADLAGAFLDAAALGGANLNDADLAGAFLNGAALRAANLHGADLAGANLTGADLTGANLTGAVWSDTTCPDESNSDGDGGTCANDL